MSNAFEELAAAIRSNDVAGARKVLAGNSALKARLNDEMPGGCFGATPLLAAVQRGNREMVELLLESGADINQRSHWWAGGFGVLDGDHGLSEFLIERGAMVDAHAAARLGKFDRLKELVARDPQVVHARGGDGQTPLHFACTIEIADFLLDHDAKIDALDVDHESTPAQWMIKDRTEVARHLVQRGARADLLLAAALGDLERVKKILAENPSAIQISVSPRWFPMKNPHAGGTIYIWTLGQNKTPHVVARDFQRNDVFQFLMEHSPEEVKLAQACELGDEELFRRLLAKNPGLVANLTAEDKRKLPDAAKNNNVDAVRLMLRAGWPVDARGQHGGTALHWAAFHGNLQLAEIVLRHNPPLELRCDDFNATPLGWATHGSLNGWHAKTGNYAGVVEALVNAGAKIPPDFDESKASAAVNAVLKRRANQS